MKKYTITVNGTAYEVEVEKQALLLPLRKLLRLRLRKLLLRLLLVQPPFPLLCRAKFCPLT